MNATTYQTIKSGFFEITIIALGYTGPNATTGQIVFTNDPQYKITAKAICKYTDNGVEVDIQSIKMVSVLNIYD
jgi:hypothetical protein